MKQVSVFHKGITTDLDYSKLDNQGIQLPTANIQLVNKDGQGLIVTPVKGNEVAFELTPGFQIIGSAEYNGIAYIASYNPETDQGEIGSFPSPNFTTNTFEEVYRPLRNFMSGISSTDGTVVSGGRVGPMRSTVFNFDLEHPIGDQMIALQDYDGSVNLIFTDNKNILRLVNSGFNQEAQNLRDRWYHTSTLETSIQLIKDLPADQSIEFLGERAGGQLEFGNYFFFYRYVDASNNRTEFVAESQPITVTRPSPERPEVLTSGFDERSGKQIKLRVQNLDNTFAYIEFAYIRFLSAGETATFPEIRLVDKFFPIPQTGGELTLEINGYETSIPFDISEILRPVNREAICKSIFSHDRRIWGANWKAQPLNYNALKTLALKIRLGYNDEKTIPNWELRNFYANPDNIQYASYFRSEAYITGAVFILNNGYRTERFPVTGLDARFLRPDQIDAAHDSGDLTNPNGIIVMPDNRFSSYLFNVEHQEGPRGHARILALSFDMRKAKEWLGLSGDQQQWINDNVREIQFVRAPRKKNLLYQGIFTRVYGKNIYHDNDPTKVTENNGVSIPLMTDYNVENDSNPTPLNTVIDMPAIKRLDSNSTDARGFPAATLFGRRVQGGPVFDAQSPDEVGRRGFFSPDFIFGDKSKVRDGDSELILRPECKLSYGFITGGNITPSAQVKEFRSVDWTNDAAGIIPNNTVIVHSENNWIRPTNAKQGFINRADDLGEVVDRNADTSNLIFWNKGLAKIDYLNRSIAIPPYIGFFLNEQVVNNSLSFKYPGRIVSVFRQNPGTLDAVAFYSDELNLAYSSISRQTYNLKTSEQDKVVCYQGDSFIQLTSIKTRTWFPTNEKGKKGSEIVTIGADVSVTGYNWSGNFTWLNSRRYAHGEILDIVTENENNLALRIATPNETAFYPAIKDIELVDEGVTIKLFNWDFSVFPYTTEPEGWGQRLTTGIESYLFNPSNSITVSIRSHLSDNPNIPKGRDVFPNRIRYTGKQEPNYPVLSYRMWNYAFKEDYEERFGEITKILMVYGRLVSVQENAIFVHATNQEEVIPTSSGEMVIGVRSILSKEPSVIGRHGSQHIFSIRQTKSGTYGWDWMNRTIWRITMTDEGFLISKSVDKEQAVENYLKRLAVAKDGEDAGLTTNIVRGMKDLMFVTGDEQEGLFTGYDKKNGEILFLSAFNGTTEIFRFNEDISGFIGTFHYPAKFFFNVHNDLFSVANPVNFTKETKENVYIHSAGMPARFYGNYHTPILSFIVNGYLGEEQVHTQIDKLFKNMEIESPRHPLPIDKIEFKTLFQEGRNDPFHDDIRFWLTPEYLMSKWAFPLNVAHKGQEQFYVESNMQGKWLKVTIFFNKGIDFFVKNVVTDFITSKA